MRWAAGKEPRAGRQPRERMSGSAAVNAEDQCASDSDERASRSRAAAGVKASARRRDGAPGGGEAHEGIELQRRLNPGVEATDSRTDESPEGGATTCGASGNRGSAAPPNDERARDADEAARLCAREIP